MRICHFCRNRLDEKMEIHRSSTCPHCSKDLKICLNCRFYSEGAHWSCLESISEPVREKDRSNFCDYFQFRDTTSGASPASDREKAKKSFDRLFGNGN